MLIKAICKKHPKAQVLLLMAPTGYMNADKQRVDENSEQATYVTLDEANLFCTAFDSANHEVGFAVVENGTICGHPEYKNGYCSEMICRNYYRI